MKNLVNYLQNNDIKNIQCSNNVFTIIAFLSKHVKSLNNQYIFYVH